MWVVAKGIVTTTDCIKVITRVLADPLRHTIATGLVDLRKAVYRHGDEAEVVRIARVLKAQRSIIRGNVAIVAQRGTLFPAEIFSLHVRDMTDIRIRVFTDLAAAEAFCGIAHTHQATPLAARPPLTAK